MGKTFELWVAFRYLRARRSEKFISLITWLSTGGVAVGVAALIIVYSVMTGYSQMLRDKIVGLKAHVTVYPMSGQMDDPGPALRAARSIDGVVSARPFVTGQAMLVSARGSSGALLRGVDPGDPHLAQAVKPMVTDGALDALNDPSPSLLLGKEMAARLELSVGDSVRVTLPVGNAPKVRTFRVGGIFSSGMYQFDDTIAFASIPATQSFMGMGGAVTGVEVRTANPMAAMRISDALGAKLGNKYWVAHWKRLNRNIFSALELQRVVLTLILTLIILVAAFNVAATLIMVVLEKTREIGILKAMGATNRAVRRIFTLEGLVIGATGAVTGLGLGLGLCWLLKTFPIIKIPSDIYLFDRLPVEVDPLVCALFAGAAMGLCWLATLYPSWQAARLDPVRTIRIE